MYRSSVLIFQERLSKQIEESINICEFSMFVFDETDKIPEGILEVVKTYLDKGKRKKGVDFRYFLIMNELYNSLFCILTFTHLT